MKKMTLQTLLLVGVMGLSASIASAAHIKLFVLTGQSNSLGTTNGGEADPTSGSDPADSHVQFFWDNLASSGSPPVSIGDSGGVFTTLQDQQGGYYGGSATHWSGEMEFARTLYRAGVRDFGIIKASRGGGGNSYWLKGSTDDHMYEHVTNTVAAATADLIANGHTFEIIGLLYLQGESDSGIEITEAGTRLKTLTDNLRADLPNASAMHTVAAGTTAAGLTSSANQAATAAITDYMDTFPNTDLADRLADSVHLNKAAKIIVGNRWAQAFLDAGIVSRHYGKLVFIGDSITQGGNGNPSYRYQVFKNLANAGVTNIAATGYEFVGSVTNAYQNNAGATPDVNGQTFVNQHDGHWGWRAFWENARVALPGGRYNVNNLGQGTLENWTGQTTTFATGDQGTIAYTGTTYVPDTASILIGINDLADGTLPTQVRDDIGTLIDQLRAANPNVSIFLNKTLHTNQGATRDQQVEDLHALLPALVDAKNAASSSSPVWLVDADEGFDPATQTYDAVHPNSSGEEYVGDRMSGGLGIIEMPAPAAPPVVPLTLEEKASDQLGSLHFEGSDIYNTGSYINNWSDTGDISPTETGANDLTLDHPGGAGDVLDGSNTGWGDINDGVWTFEARLKFNANPNGFILWLGTGTHRILVEIYGDRTQDLGNNSFNVAHDNLDGNYHTFTVTHDPSASLYYVWRDGILLNTGGSPYDQTGADERLLLGDYTGGTFGDGFNVTIDHIAFGGGYKGNEIYASQSVANTVVWRRDWESLAHNTTITASNLDGGPRASSVEVGTQDFTVVSGPVRSWDGVVGGRDLISTTGGGLFEATVEITDVQYAADTPLTLDFVIGTGDSGNLTGNWFVEFGTISNGVFSVLSAVDSGSASYNSGSITLNSDENFMDNANNSPLFGYNVGGRLQQLVVDAADAVNGTNVAIRFGISSSLNYAGFTDMALSVPGGSVSYSYINGWGHGASVDPNPTLVNTNDLRVVNTTTSTGSWLDGTGTGWPDINDGYWTFETRLKFDALPNGIALWLGTGSHRILVEIYGDRTQDTGAQSFNVAHNNLDSAFHTYRVGHDPLNSVYHVWRDGERLTSIDGAGYDATASDNNLILGDYTSGTFGNGFDATIDYIRWDTGNVYLPPGADADSDGMSDLYEDTYFGGLTNGVAGDHDDSDDATNLEEYIADTSPIDGNSLFGIGTFEETVPDTWSITVPDSSPRRNYTLYASGDIGLTDPWTVVPGQGPVMGNGSDLVFSETMFVSTSRFYRVEVAIP